MDLSQLKEAAIAATVDALQRKLDVMPGEDSDEWEEEYRRQFALPKQRHGGGPQAPPPARPPWPALQLPELSGSRSRSVGPRRCAPSGCARSPSGRSRLDRADLDPRQAMGRHPRGPGRYAAQRAQSQYDEYRTQDRRGTAKARAAEAQQKAAAARRLPGELQQAGITPDGLIELIDASERFDPARWPRNLAKSAVAGRHLRIFETADPNLLLVKEKVPEVRSRLRIERDEGLVGDLKLFVQAP